MNISAYKSSLQDALTAVYDQRESENLANYLLEEVFGKKRVREDSILSAEELHNLNLYKNRLLRSEPIQYVLGTAWFYGLKFNVTPDVLIPRPETEELVEYALTHVNNGKHNILDIGTGSGCIAIALKKNLPLCTVTALDISPVALYVAKQNAELHKISIQLIEADITIDALELSEKYSLIISNPPYIHPDEKKDMHANVLQYEPHLALFTPQNDALFYYNAIAKKSLKYLKPSGILLFEIHSQQSKEISALLTDSGYHEIEIIHDMQNKPRIAKAINK